MAAMVVRLAAAIPLLALLAWAGRVAIDTARADRYVTAASTEMGTWAVTGTQPQLGTWGVVRDQLNAGLQLAPHNPTAHELLGLLGTGRRDSPEAIADGASHLRTALQLRPASPYAWASLVEAQYRQGEPGRNMQLPILRAAALGPSEPGVQRVIADYGLAIWDEVDAPTQRAIDRFLGAGFRRNPLEMLLISERRGRLDTACRHLDGLPRTSDPRLTARCEGRETTP